MATTPNPQDRRRGFVNRLYAQYQQGQGAGRAAPGMGTPFHGGIRSAPAIHTQTTNFDNIGGGIRNALGVGGNSHFLPGDAGMPGQEVALNHPGGMPLPQAVSLPLPGQGVGQPISPPPPGPISGGSAANGGAPGMIGGPGQVAPATPFGAGGAGLPADAIPLGNGTFWSPTAGILTSGSQVGLGAAAASLQTTQGGGGPNARPY